jgi:hypothetical protein
LVEAPALTDLTLDEVLDARSLKLITPRLQVLRVLGCYSLEEIAVSAMRLDRGIPWILEAQCKTIKRGLI